jgi:hypothetical protein
MAVPGRAVDGLAVDVLRALVGAIREAHDPATDVLEAEDRATPSDLAVALAGRVTVSLDRSGRDRPARALAGRDPAGAHRAGRGSREVLPGRALPAAGAVRASMIDVLDSACMPTPAISSRARRAHRGRADRRIGPDGLDRVVRLGPAAGRRVRSVGRKGRPIGIRGDRTNAAPAPAHRAVLGPISRARATGRPDPGRPRPHPRSDGRGRGMPGRRPSSRWGPTRRWLLAGARSRRRSPPGARRSVCS